MLFLSTLARKLFIGTKCVKCQTLTNRKTF